MIARIPPPIDDETLLWVSDANPGWRIERESDGSLTMSPTGGSTGVQEVALIAMLWRWNEEHGHGVLFSPDTGFTMPDGSIPAPDAAWIRIERWRAISRDERKRYARIVPDLCVEVRSPGDSLPVLRRKIRRYRDYGVSYAVLIDPLDRTTLAEGEPPEGFPTDFTAVYDAE